LDPTKLAPVAEPFMDITVKPVSSGNEWSLEDLLGRIDG
jgi:hypothetical protein